MHQWAALTGIGLAALGWACAIAPNEDVRRHIVGLERTALDRWGRGDPGGFLALYAPDVRYVDPAQDGWLTGAGRMKDVLTPLTGKVRIDRYEMIDPVVRPYGDLAVLSYGVVNYRRQDDGRESEMTRWNSTTVYGRVDGEWKIVHSHWSYTRPELRQPVAE